MHRVHDNLSASAYGSINPSPEKISKLSLDTPHETQYILRMPISTDCGKTLHIPPELKWTVPIVNLGLLHQHNISSEHPFVYLTIRHGWVESKTDDEWHVDGFSVRIAHRPEQNYIWCNIEPTEWWDENIPIPEDFNPHIHNIHQYFQDKIGNKTHAIKQMEEKSVYCIDPYIIHRRPPNTFCTYRTFVRVSFIPIPILDVNNTQNPLLAQPATSDGIFRRNLLKRYPAVLS